MLRRPEQLRRVDQAPVDPPYRARGLERGKEAVDRPRQADIEVRHRRMDRIERPAELVGEPPVRRKAQDRPGQPVAGRARLQQTKILLDHPAKRRERLRRIARKALAGHLIDEGRAALLPSVGKVFSQILDHQRVQLLLARDALGQSGHHLGRALGQQSAPLRHLMADVWPGLEPVGRRQRVQAHGEAIRPVQEAVVWHAAMRSADRPLRQAGVDSALPAHYNRQGRGVAQPGSASALGAEGRLFESDRPDHSESQDFRGFQRIRKVSGSRVCDRPGPGNPAPKGDAAP
jgi:hypothetical protein